MNKLKTKIPPPVISLLIGLLMWVLNTNFPIIRLELSYSYYIAVFLISIGMSLDIISFFNFRKNKTTINPMSPQKTSHLVISGFYRFTRNPMYLGMFFILSGVATLFSSISVFFALPLFIIAINNLQIKPEEDSLEKIFGRSFIEYKNKVRRWI